MKQDELFNSEHGTRNTEPQPVTCLGIEFPSDEARREHFTELLRDRLRDPEFRKIEGFPIGSDEDILNLSDPPYYTACPNPWIADFIAEWEAQKPEQAEGNHYHREPFAADVSEGKSDPIYIAHTYHTKVPHKAIMRYILHYTQPGDIVFDGFCGTGMTGVAAQMCGDREEVMSLGYQVKPDGTILAEEVNEAGKKVWRPFSKLGTRRALLNDLSPAATFIADNYNAPVDVTRFEKDAKHILKEVEKECGWMYETLHSDGKTIGYINFTLWSDVFLCSQCSSDVVFWDAAVNTEIAEVTDNFSCPSCHTLLSKRNAERSFISSYDEDIKQVVRQAKQVPVLINYSVNGISYRFEKKPDQRDLELIDRIGKEISKKWYPTQRMMIGQETRRNDPIGMTHVHHFYTSRNLAVLSRIYDKVKGSRLLFLFTGFVGGATKLNQFHLKHYVYGGGGVNPGTRKGTLYAPSISMEEPVILLFKNRLRTQLRALRRGYYNVNIRQVIATSSCNDMPLTGKAGDVLDYIFIDPPFGSNLNYSELSYFWECWLGVSTENTNEAIENSVQGKGALEYRKLMTGCFKRAYELLKPGRWMTVEFSNTKANVWNNIQAAITEAGFIVANVSVLDKKQGGINANVTKTAVKQDLAISAYKPNGGFEARFQKEAQSEEGVWDFVHTHLKYLPVTKQQGALLQFVPERDPRILFDQMVAYYVRKGYPVPISSQEFQIGLSQRFIERDGMVFLPDQVAEYDRKKMTSEGVGTNVEIWVSDEASAILWLRQLIKEKPQTFSDINPQFMQHLGGWSKNEAHLDLRELLTQNFLCYDGKGLVPDQIHSYLSTNWKDLRNLSKDDPTLVGKARDRWFVPDPNKAEQVEKMREKDLLKEFELYKDRTKKFKNNDRFRIEAVRAGFKKAWQEREYAVIVAVADKIPNNVLEEDPKLLMWYDQAVTRMGGE